MYKKLAGNIALLLTSMIWGLSFVAQRAGMEYIGPFTFNALRSFLGGLSLLPLIWLYKFLTLDTRTPLERQLQHQNLAIGGIVCGLALFTAMSIQQFCMQYVPAGKAGFISALYLIFVPLISLFFNNKINPKIFVSVVVAVLGLFLLCFKSDASFNVYDLVLLSSAFFYGVHIIIVGYFSQRINAAKLCCTQFFVVGLLSLPLVFCLETPALNLILSCKIPLFFAGVITCGVAYTLQIFGQKNTNPVAASLILSLESVFAVAGGMLFLNEIMTVRELIGCVFMIFAVLLSEFQKRDLYPSNCSTKN